MNSISNGWDSTKQTKTSYFHCGPSSQNEKTKAGKTNKQKNT